MARGVIGRNEAPPAAGPLGRLLERLSRSAGLRGRRLERLPFGGTPCYPAICAGALPGRDVVPRDLKRSFRRLADGMAQWGGPTVGSGVFLFVSGFVLLLGGGMVGGGIGAIVGLAVWLWLIGWIAWKGGPQEVWRQLRQGRFY